MVSLSRNCEVAKYSGLIKWRYKMGLRRMGGGGAGPGGECVCHACGYREPHDQGQPCNQKKCPKCGQTMARG